MGKRLEGRGGGLLEIRPQYGGAEENHANLPGYESLVYRMSVWTVITTLASTAAFCEPRIQKQSSKRKTEIGCWNCLRENHGINVYSPLNSREGGHVLRTTKGTYVHVYVPEIQNVGFLFVYYFKFV